MKRRVTLGSRKMVAFFTGMSVIGGIILLAIYKNVPLTGDNIEHLCWIVLFLVLAFMGGNSLEWFSKARVGKFGNEIEGMTNNKDEH